MSESNDKNSENTTINKNPNSIDDNLLNDLYNKTKEFHEALTDKPDPTKAQTLSTQIKNLESQINNSAGRYNLDLKVNKLVVPQTRKSILTKYRSAKPNISEDSVAEVNRFFNAKKVTAEHSDNTELHTQVPKLRILDNRVLQINERLDLNFKFDKLQLTSTPFSTKKPHNVKKQLQFTIANISPIKEESPNTSNLHISIKELLEKDESLNKINPENIKEFISDKKFIDEITELSNNGLNLQQIFNFAKRKVANFFNYKKIDQIIEVNTLLEQEKIKLEEVVRNTKAEQVEKLAPLEIETKNTDNVNLSGISTPSLILNSESDTDTIFDSDIETEINKMTNRIPEVRGLSLSNILDCIPRFNGSNIKLTSFLDGLTVALQLLPNHLNGELAKLVRLKLYGEALRSIEDKEFGTIEQITEYLEDVFGSSKTYHDWTGEIAKVRQNKDETVVIYLNKMKEIIKEIKKSARREKRLTAETEQAFLQELDKDCLKFFLRGIRFDIRARMGTPKTFEEACKMAFETEKAFALDQIDNDVESLQLENKGRGAKETRRINIVEMEPPAVICQFCNKQGHVAINCFQLTAKIANSNNQNQYNNRNNNGQNFNNQQRFNRNYDNQQNFRNNSNYRNNFNNQQNFRNDQSGNYNRNNPNNFNNHNNLNNNNDINNNRINSQGPNSQNNNNNQNNNSNNANSIVRCDFCNKIGHLRQQCFKLQRQMQEQNQNSLNMRGLGSTGGGQGSQTPARPAASRPTESPQSRGNGQ